MTRWHPSEFAMSHFEFPGRLPFLWGVLIHNRSRIDDQGRGNAVVNKTSENRP